MRGHEIQVFGAQGLGVWESGSLGVWEFRSSGVWESGCLGKKMCVEVHSRVLHKRRPYFDSKSTKSMQQKVALQIHMKAQGVAVENRSSRAHFLVEGLGFSGMEQNIP